MATYSFSRTQSWTSRRATKLFLWTLIVAFLLGAVPTLLAADSMTLAEWVATETPRGHLAELDVSPDFVSLEAGGFVEFIAVGLYETYDKVQWCTDLSRDVTWASSDPGVIAVDAFGRAVALTEGEASITASTESRLTAAWITVQPATVFDLPTE